MIPSTFPENLDKASFASPAEYVAVNSKCKADELVVRLGSSDPRGLPDLIICACMQFSDYMRPAEQDGLGAISCGTASRSRAHALCLTRTLSADRFYAAADTVVVAENEILEKPSSPEHAKAMLRRLSGRTHTVLTGVTLVLCREQTECAHV